MHATRDTHTPYEREKKKTRGHSPLTLETERRTQITSLGVLAAFLHLHPGLGDKKWRALRLAVLVATGLSAFVPIVHAVTLFPYAQLESQAGLRYYYLEGALMLVGAGFYAVGSSSMLPQLPPPR